MNKVFVFTDTITTVVTLLFNYKIECKITVDNKYIVNIPFHEVYGPNTTVNKTIYLNSIPSLHYVKSATAYLNADNFCSLRLNSIYILNHAYNDWYNGYKICNSYQVNIPLPLNNSDVIIVYGIDDGINNAFISGKIIFIYE